METMVGGFDLKNRSKVEGRTFYKTVVRPAMRMDRVRKNANQTER